MAQKEDSRQLSCCLFYLPLSRWLLSRPRKVGGALAHLGSTAHLEMESDPPLKPLSISQSQKTIHEPKMYTKGSTTPQVAVVSTSAQPSTTTEPLTYWTDARSSTMARPSPSVSNCGLVIVQVQDNNRTTGQFVEENRTFYHHEPQSLTNWSNITLDNRIFLSDSTNMSVTQSPVIGNLVHHQILNYILKRPQILRNKSFCRFVRLFWLCDLT